MAGFDFDFEYATEYEPYIEACLRVSKSRARGLGCRWRVERLRDDLGGRRCTVDGNTGQLDLLGRTLEHDLPIVCEGVRGGLSPKQARKLGLGFAELYHVGRDTSSDDGIQVLRPKDELSLYHPIYVYADPCRGSVALRARLRVTEDVTTDFALGRYPPEVLLEEIHTGLEQTLTELLPSVKGRARWPELLKSAMEAGLLTGTQDGWMGWVDHPHTDIELLQDLAKQRNVSKHRMMTGSNNTWVSEHWRCVALLLERLVRREWSAAARRLQP